MTPCHEICFRIVAFSYLFMLIFSLARNLSCNGKDNPFCDICRMVPDSFKIFCNHQKVYCLFPFISMISDKFNQFLLTRNLDAAQRRIFTYYQLRGLCLLALLISTQINWERIWGWRQEVSTYSLISFFNYIFPFRFRFCSSRLGYI